jgi:hypothetical protein
VSEPCGACQGGGINISFGGEVEKWYGTDDAYEFHSLCGACGGTGTDLHLGLLDPFLPQ